MHTATVAYLTPPATKNVAPSIDALMRDEFALRALEGLLASSRDGIPAGSELTIAKRAYTFADAMIVARKAVR